MTGLDALRSGSAGRERVPGRIVGTGPGMGICEYAYVHGTERWSPSGPRGGLGRFVVVLRLLREGGLRSPVLALSHR